MLHGHDNIEMDTTRTRDKFFKIYAARVSDTFQTRHDFMIGVSVLHRTYQL